jgi:ferredoxin
MIAKVLQERCGGVGMCVKICPDLFRFQEGSKKATTLFDRVPIILQEKCLKAADSCPNKAIIIVNK